MQPLSAMLEAIAADNVADRCPKCNSATTGMLMDEEGNMSCHSCGHIWKGKAVKDPSLNKETHVRHALVDGPDAAANQAQTPNPIAVPIAEQGAPHNNESQDSSLSWKDTNGEPITQGQEYEMHNPSYMIPDIVKVMAVKPDGLEVQLLGTFANEPNSMQVPTTISIRRWRCRSSRLNQLLKMLMTATTKLLLEPQA